MKPHLSKAMKGQPAHPAIGGGLGCSAWISVVLIAVVCWGLAFVTLVLLYLGA
jgi:hypothetical protein